MCDFLLYDGEAIRQCENPDIGYVQEMNGSLSHRTCFDHAKILAQPEYLGCRLVLDEEINEYGLDEICLRIWDGITNDFEQKLADIRERMGILNEILDDYNHDTR